MGGLLALPVPSPAQQADVQAAVPVLDSLGTNGDTATVIKTPEGQQPFRRAKVKFFTADYATLRYGPGLVQLEIYALIDRGSLAVEDEDSTQLASYQITFRIYHADSLITGDSWVRYDRSLTSEQRRPGQKIPELIKYVVRPGKYRLEVEVADLVGHVFRRDVYPVEVKAYDEDHLTLSDMIIASRIEKPMGDAGEFDHNGLLVLPNAERMFGAGSPQLFYYLELYHLSTGEGDRYVVKRRILNDVGEEVKVLKERDRVVPAPDCVDFGAFSVATLQTGSYRLVIDVTDVASGETAVTERTFWVYRPGMQAETQARRIALAEPGFDIAAMSDAEVASELEKVEILLQSKIARSVRQLGPQDKRAFLAGFWSSNDPDTTTRTNEWRDEFLRRIDEANARYGSLNKVGWKSDQGRVYVRFGEPDRIEDHPFDYGVGKAYQVWEYDNIEGGVIFVFVDRNNYGDYVQVHSTLNGEINNPNWIQQELRARP